MRGSKGSSHTGHLGQRPLLYTCATSHAYDYLQHVTVAKTSCGESEVRSHTS